MQEAHEEVLSCQNNFLANPSSLLAERELETEEKWQILCKAEESFLYQRARITWMNEGNSSSAFYH